MSGEPSTYVQGMVVFHTLRALRDWIRSIEQTLLHRMNIRAGSAAVRHQLYRWLDTVRRS